MKKEQIYIAVRKDDKQVRVPILAYKVTEDLYVHKGFMYASNNWTITSKRCGLCVGRYFVKRSDALSFLTPLNIKVCEEKARLAKPIEEYPIE